MLKYSMRIYSEQKIRSLSNIVLEEMSSGVYYVAKDRYESIDEKYIDSKFVATLLNHSNKVIIVPLLLASGNIVYSNYNYDHELIRHQQRKE